MNENIKDLFPMVGVIGGYALGAWIGAKKSDNVSAIAGIVGAVAGYVAASTITAEPSGAPYVFPKSRYVFSDAENAEANRLYDAMKNHPQLTTQTWYKAYWPWIEKTVNYPPGGAAGDIKTALIYLRQFGAKLGVK